MDLEQRHIIKFLLITGRKLGETAEELSSAYDPDAYTPLRLRYGLHQIKLGRTDLRTRHSGGRPPLGDIDTEFLSFLRKYLFASVRTAVESLEIRTSAIYSRLVEKISYCLIP
jgi:hypothetical protein